jgi:hypothetical protein
VAHASAEQLGHAASLAWLRLSFGTKSPSRAASCSSSRKSARPSFGTGTAIVASPESPCPVVVEEPRGHRVSRR